MLEITKEEYIKGVVNDVKKSEGKVRQGAKPVYFALNYAGTYRTLMKSIGFSEEKAKFLEDSHRELYRDYYKYIDDKLDEAETTGFVRLAYGLKLRTPIIKAGVSSKLPKHKIEQERRSAGNALFQSYGLVTLRSFTKFMELVWNHPEYKAEILPVITIYDSIYLNIPNDIDCLHWVNENLIACMEDVTGCEELIHKDIALSSNLEVFYPSWNNPISLDNGMNKEDILDKLVRLA